MKLTKEIQNFINKVKNDIDFEFEIIETINNSFTNKVYKIKDNDGNYWKLRFCNSNNKFINRLLEKNIELKLNNDELKYYDNDYNFIKKWYDGHNLEPKDITLEVFNNITLEINKLQNLDIKNININKPKYYDDLEIDNDLKKPLLLYKEITNQFNQNDFVLCHNDCSCANLIINGKSVKLIDYEWAGYNHKLWDVCNLIKDLEFNLEDLNKVLTQEKNIKQYVEIIYATHFYTYFWTIRVESTKKVLEYRKHIKERLLYWYRVLLNEF